MPTDGPLHKNMTFQPGEQVDIIAGSYKGRQGTYLLAPAGFRGLSARIKVDGDSRESRSLCLASLQATPPPSPARHIPSSRTATTDRRLVSPMWEQSGDSFLDLVEKACDIARRVTDLIQRLEADFNVSGYSTRLDD
jgi:hypothetical protein